MHSGLLTWLMSQRKAMLPSKPAHSRSLFSKSSSWIQSLFKASETGTQNSHLCSDDKLQEKDFTSYIVHKKISRAFNFV